MDSNISTQTYSLSVLALLIMKDAILDLRAMIAYKIILLGVIHMYRKIVAITLAVSFIAIATSGVMMFIVDKTSFTLQMHPVHKQFGLLMVISAVLHVVLNFKSLLKHLKYRMVKIVGIVLITTLVLLYGVVANNKIPNDIARQLDSFANEADMAAHENSSLH